MYFMSLIVHVDQHIFALGTIKINLSGIIYKPFPVSLCILYVKVEIYQSINLGNKILTVWAPKAVRKSFI